MFPFELYRTLGVPDHSILFASAVVSILLGLLLGSGVEYAQSKQLKRSFSKSRCLFNCSFAAAVLFAFHYGARDNEAKFARYADKQAHQL